LFDTCVIRVPMSETRMARPNQVPESSMEEILASIRKIISEDEAKPSVMLRPTLAPQPAPRPASNVSRLFADEPAEPVARTEEKSAVESVAEAMSLGSDPGEIEEDVAPPAAYQEEEPEPEPARAPEPRRTMTIEPAAAVEAALSTHDWRPAEPRAAHQPTATQTLLSPRADAAVASAFNHLAGTILATNSRTIEQMAEDMMRPMLKDWLDDNLPPLVEKLVREEIERVSRRR
jgi:cell pole-organizing protein PopZ